MNSIYKILSFIFFTLFITDYAQQINLPIKIQVPLYVKIFSYERNIMQSASDEIIVAVLYQKNYKNSYLAKNEVELKESNNKFFLTTKMKVTFIYFDVDEADIFQIASKSKINIFYILPLRAFELNQIKIVAVSKKILTITAASNYVEKGFSIGLDLKDEKPLIMINLNSAKSEGADFSSQLLKLAKIIN